MTIHRKVLTSGYGNCIFKAILYEGAMFQEERLRDEELCDGYYLSESVKTALHDSFKMMKYEL
jgi:hypothetical protein